MCAFQKYANAIFFGKQQGFIQLAAKENSTLYTILLYVDSTLAPWWPYQAIDSFSGQFKERGSNTITLIIELAPWKNWKTIYYTACCDSEAARFLCAPSRGGGAFSWSFITTSTSLWLRLELMVVLCAVLLQILSAIQLVNKIRVPWVPRDLIVVPG